MTYILGIKKFGAVAIFSDTLATHGPPGAEVQRPEFMKSGVLYPGCIYGVAGDSNRAYDFLDFVRSRLPSTTMNERWNALRHAVSIYNFTGGRADRFYIMFASRHTGEPQLYGLSSLDEDLAEINPRYSIVSFGSGKPLLDPMIWGFASSEHHGGDEGIAALVAQLNGDPARDFPYFYLALLHRYTESQHGHAVNRAGVGGYFNFIWQSRDGEERQRPIMYYLTGPLADGSHFLAQQRIAFDTHPDLGDVLVVFQRDLADGGGRGTWAVLLNNRTGSNYTDNNFEQFIHDAVNRNYHAEPYHFLVATSVHHGAHVCYDIMQNSRVLGDVHHMTGDLHDLMERLAANTDTNETIYFFTTDRKAEWVAPTENWNGRAIVDGRAAIRLLP